MYQGKNPSARRSQTWLVQALLELMQEKPYSKITIKELTERSDLSRQTFYQVFQSREEIIEYHLDCLFEKYLQEIQSLKISSTEGLAKIVFSFARQNETFIRALIENDLTGILNRKMQLYMDEVRIAVDGERQITFNDYASAFICAGLVGILVYWFEKKKGMELEELAGLVGNLLNESYLREI